MKLSLLRLLITVAIFAGMISASWAGQAHLVVNAKSGVILAAENAATSALQ